MCEGDLNYYLSGLLGRQNASGEPSGPHGDVNSCLAHVVTKKPRVAPYMFIYR